MGIVKKVCMNKALSQKVGCKVRSRRVMKVEHIKEFVSRLHRRSACNVKQILLFFWYKDV